MGRSMIQSRVVVLLILLAAAVWVGPAAHPGSTRALSNVKVYFPIIRGFYPPYPEIPWLHPIDNADGDGNYTVRWDSAARAESYELEERWQDGYASGAVYHGDATHIDFLNQVYAIHSQSNPLHSDLWPSAAKHEAEVVAMTAHMLGAQGDEEICGTISSGGTESILLAMKTYRDRARAERGIHKPEMVAPVTAHAAFHKAAQYFNIKLKLIPVDQDFRAVVDAAPGGRHVIQVGAHHHVLVP